MEDWADEIEATIASEYGSHGAILAADADGMIAAALRKAVDDERKLIADWIKSKIRQTYNDFDDGWNNACDDLFLSIERGEYKKGQ